MSLPTRLADAAGPGDDADLASLDRLETELFRDHPDVSRAIAVAVADFLPAATAIEQRHGGRALLAPVQARRLASWRQSAHPLLAAVSFAVLVLPVFAVAIAIRGRMETEIIARAVAVLLVIAAVLCLVKVVSTWRDRVWAGVMLHWAAAAALCAVVATSIAFGFHASYPGAGAGTWLRVAAAATVVIVAFAVLSAARAIGSSRRWKADFADTQPAIDAYLAELSPVYDRALAHITAAVNTLDPNLRTTLLRHRNAEIANLAGNRGLYRGQVPLFVNKKALGELSLVVAAEPLLGGGPYPVRSRPARSRVTGVRKSAGA